jgi:phage terminase large subunit GpA-like protein
VVPRTVVPIKGSDNAFQIISSVSKEDASRKRQGVRIVGLGTHCIKGEIYDVLRHVAPKADDVPVPGCYHFPHYERSYFQGLCSEKRVVRESGVAWEKLPNVRNEPFDLKVYNRGVAAVFGIDRMTDAQWKAFEEALKPITGDDPEPAKESTEERLSEQRRDSWIPKRDWFKR